MSENNEQSTIEQEVPVDIAHEESTTPLDGANSEENAVEVEGNEDTAAVESNNVSPIPTSPQPSDNQPMFYIEPKKNDCNRDDKTLLVAKKVGFYGLVSCLILSIIFGAITRLWSNSLNILFMGLAVMMYGVQHIIHIKALGTCNCSSCRIQRHKSKMIIIACSVGFVVLVTLFFVKQFVGF